MASRLALDRLLGRKLRRDFPLEFDIDRSKLGEQSVEIREGKLVFRITPTKDFSFAIRSIDTDGQVVQLFPNRRESDNRLLAGRTRTIPDPKLDYPIRAVAGDNDDYLYLYSTTASWKPIAPLADTLNRFADVDSAVRAFRKVSVDDGDREQVSETRLRLHVVK